MKKLFFFLLAATVISVAFVSLKNVGIFGIANEFSSYYLAKKFSEFGWNRAAHWMIEDELESKNQMAQNMLVGYFTLSIKNNDFEGVKYWLGLYPELINAEYKQPDYEAYILSGNKTIKIKTGRAIDIELTRDNATNSTQMLELLLSYKPELNYHMKDLNGITPLIASIMMYDYNKTKLLVDAGADVNLLSDDRIGYSPLEISYFMDKFDIFKMLLERGAKPQNSKWEHSNTIKSISVDISMALLCKKGRILNEPTDKACAVAAKNSTYQAKYANNMKYLKEILKRNTNLESGDKEGFTFLGIILAATNQTDKIKELMSYNLCEISNCTEIERVAKLNGNDEVTGLIKSAQK